MMQDLAELADLFWTISVKHFLALNVEEMGMTDVKLRLSAIEQKSLLQWLVTVSSSSVVFAELEKCFNFVPEFPRFNDMVFTADEV